MARHDDRSVTTFLDAIAPVLDDGTRDRHDGALRRRPGTRRRERPHWRRFAPDGVDGACRTDAGRAYFFVRNATLSTKLTTETISAPITAVPKLLTRRP